MAKQVPTSPTLRWVYIIVALMVLVGLGTWLYSTYNVAPATSSVPGTAATGTSPN